MVRKAVQRELTRRARTAEGFDGGRSWRDVSNKPGSDGLERKKINRGVQKRTSCATLLCPKCGPDRAVREGRALFRECEGPEQNPLRVPHPSLVLWRWREREMVFQPDEIMLMGVRTG